MTTGFLLAIITYLIVRLVHVKRIRRTYRDDLGKLCKSLAAVVEENARLRLALARMEFASTHGRRPSSPPPRPPEQWPDWAVTLGIRPGDIIDEIAIRRAYREKAKTAHPDQGGSVAAMTRLNAAREAALDALRRRART